MSTTPPALMQLIELSRELGRPELDFAMLGEGNTSARADERFFWVKTSGSMLSNISERGFVRLDRIRAEKLLDAELPTDAAILEALLNVTTDRTGRRPSIESMMHAYLLGIPGVNFVGHTHPAAVNALLCSVNAEELVHACLFPDQIVCCGPAPVYVPYSDPGLPLARLVRERTDAWMQHHGMAPKALMLQNHGLFATGVTPQAVISCTMMWAKTARVIAGAMACGGLHTLTTAQVERIFTRPDEKFREQALAQRENAESRIQNSTVC